jgi:hypothetical protein
MCKAGAGKAALAFVAGGAVLRVDVIHCDFEHVVAADADAMDLYGRLLTRPFTGRLIRVGGLLLFAHAQILAHRCSSGAS